MLSGKQVNKSIFELFVEIVIDDKIDARIKDQKAILNRSKVIQFIFQTNLEIY